jgi:LysM repeat protein
MVDCIMFSKRYVPADVQLEAGAPSHNKSESTRQEGFVNRTICSQARLVFLLLALLVLALTACERPLQPREVLEAPSPTPVLAPPVLPTPLPGIVSEPPAGEAVPPEGEGAAEEAPAAETPPGGEAPATQPEPPPATQPVEPAPTGPVSYVVQAGDTLGRIAQRYNVSVEEIAAANNITNIHRLEVGQTLTIPVGGATAPPATGETIHVVQRGETLFRIALRYGLTAEEVAAYNGITNVHLIYPGQEIRIPAR